MESILICISILLSATIYVLSHQGSVVDGLTWPVYVGSRNIYHVPIDYSFFTKRPNQTVEQISSTQPERRAINLFKSMKFFNPAFKSHKETGHDSVRLNTVKNSKSPSYLKLMFPSRLKFRSNIKHINDHGQDSINSEEQSHSNSKDLTNDLDIQSAKENTKLMNFAAFSQEPPLNYLINPHPTHLYPHTVGMTALPSNYENYLMVPHLGSPSPSIQGISHIQQHQQVTALAAAAAAAAAATAASVQRQQQQQDYSTQSHPVSSPAISTQTNRPNGSNGGSGFQPSHVASPPAHTHSHHYYPITFLSSTSSGLDYMTHGPYHENNYYTDQTTSKDLSDSSSTTVYQDGHNVPGSPSRFYASSGNGSQGNTRSVETSLQYFPAHFQNMIQPGHHTAIVSDDPPFHHDLNDVYRTASFVRATAAKASSLTPSRLTQYSRRPSRLSTEQSQSTNMQLMPPANFLSSLEHHINLPYDLDMAGDTYED